MDSKNLKYLIPSIIFLILSAFGIFYIINSSKSTPSDSSEIQDLTPEISITPTPTISETQDLTSEISITATPTASPTATKKITPTVTPKITITPTATPTAKLTPTPSEIRDLKSEISITPTPINSNYSSSTDGFSIVYSSFRKLYQDKETSGNRYTFYSNTSNFAVHVGLNNQWAWTNPDRNFSGNLVLSGQNTYRYDTDSQTIVDIQYNNKNYTLQCVHNGKSTLKAECETFLQSFKLI